MRISKSRLTTQTFSHFVSLACLLFAIASYIFSHLFILFHFFSPSVRGQCKCTCECLCVGLTATYAAHAHCAVRVRTAGSAGPSSVALLCLPSVCQTITTTTAECPDSKKKKRPKSPQLAAHLIGFKYRTVSETFGTMPISHWCSFDVKWVSLRNYHYFIENFSY